MSVYIIFILALTTFSCSAQWCPLFLRDERGYQIRCCPEGLGRWDFCCGKGRCNVFCRNCDGGCKKLVDFCQEKVNQS
uniref:Uncharacterized protein n=1 Tax=Acrobeloides nanus TaxID=290746 RepID=A0A914DAE4_9BILA